jgi:urea carboxylase
VKDIVFNARYLVMGLGDVYLGAPVATPLDPRHRLVTTKYNPARTWTPENAVGIGGAYLCVYGMEGPGGYQFVGRTVQMWNHYRQTQDFTGGKQWLLRFFDQLRFYPVSENELTQMRADFVHGRFSLNIEHTTLRLRDYRDFLEQNHASIAAFKQKQQTAFEAERERWVASGQNNVSPDLPDEIAGGDVGLDIPPGCIAIASPVTGSVWQIAVKAGDTVQAGDTLVVVEAMKMEIAVEADESGIIREVLVAQGGAVSAGQPVLILELEKTA